MYRIIHLPDHVEVAALADNLKLWTNVSLVDVSPIEYFTVSVPTGDGDTYASFFLNSLCVRLRFFSYLIHLFFLKNSGGFERLVSRSEELRPQQRSQIPRSFSRLRRAGGPDCSATMVPYVCIIFLTECTYWNRIIACKFM